MSVLAIRLYSGGIGGHSPDIFPCSVGLELVRSCIQCATNGNLPYRWICIAASFYDLFKKLLILLTG